MSKVKIKTTLVINNQQEQKELIGIIQDNIIKFINEPYKTTFNYDTNTLINESDETRLEITFDLDKTISRYLLKNYKLFLMTMYVKKLFFVILNKNISHYCAFSRLIKL